MNIKLLISKTGLSATNLVKNSLLSNYLIQRTERNLVIGPTEMDRMQSPSFSFRLQLGFCSLPGLAERRTSY